MQKCITHVTRLHELEFFCMLFLYATETSIVCYKCFGCRRAFAPSSSEVLSFLACHHSITDFEINAFLNQDSYRLTNLRSLCQIYFFFGWGLLHGPQQGPDRMKEKTYKTGKRKTPA